MVRQRIQIKKIDNVAARQVTFSKRRRGLFKKANELALLCDAEIALMVFSNTGKLFEYSSSSMKHVIERHAMQSRNTNDPDEPSLELQLENGTIAVLSREIEEKTLEISQLMGEEINGLGMEDLIKLEKSVEGSLSRVIKTKSEKYVKEIGDLERKQEELVEENNWLKKQVQMLNVNQGNDQDKSTESNVTNNCSSSDHYESDTSLKLGLPFPN
ncbi:MADS-box protein JOINTLESS-like isoform X2 [Impatiens glandulifera]|nr:MADS-box protein JOINTLESS-like isoform X2 [Impatiens glandulifera]XP_047315153.1 MADS-box protein JOINTLESS-like isoform X2 [Impatiens glandulifera]XP_047315154.1 MADS-box protein JOINTLESS-like isoform X2 [Impatiens glandulifera]XP_047315155.1 MADS-box protein JOINTLESS-like isoform X2 [Impatiens glandulifera]